MTASKTTATVFTDRTGRDYVRIDWPSGTNIDIYPNDRKDLNLVPVWLRPEVEKMLDYLADNQPDYLPDNSPGMLSSEAFSVPVVPTDQLVNFISDLVLEVRQQGIYTGGSLSFGRLVDYPRLDGPYGSSKLAVADNVEHMIWRVAKKHGVRRKNDQPVSEGQE